jgi:site-specific DNA-methyltransferase (adenine-specific)
MAFMADKPDNYYDLAIVDPPYGIKRFERPAGKTRFKSSKEMQEKGLRWDKKPSKKYFIELMRVAHYCIIWGGNNFYLPESEYFVIWNKKQTVNNFASAEFAWTNNPIPSKVFEYSIHQHNKTNKIHPTEKPMELYRWLLKLYAKPNDKILDTHGGSMSIAIACHDMGYDLDVCELDKDYFEAAKKRYENHVSQTRMF